jgi:Cu-Zn family superoxide dismutase
MTTAEHPHRRARRLRFAAASTLTLGLGLSILHVDAVSGEGWQARAVLRDTSGRRLGVVTFDGDEHGTDVKVRVSDVAEGLDAYHGIHIHAGATTGRCDPATTPAFTNVGGHWTTGAETHGRHTGDLPPVLVQADGSGAADTHTGRFEPSQLIGRAVILHAGADNLANIPPRYVTGTPPVAGPDAATNGTGDAGGRLACGVITRD